MSTSRQETRNANELWAGEVKLTVHVPKELTPSEAQELAKSLEVLADKFKALARNSLPRGCVIDVQVG